MLLKQAMEKYSPGAPDPKLTAENIKRITKIKTTIPKYIHDL